MNGTGGRGVIPQKENRIDEAVTVALFELSQLTNLGKDRHLSWILNSTLLRGGPPPAVGVALIAVSGGE